MRLKQRRAALASNFLSMATTTILLLQNIIAATATLPSPSPIDCTFERTPENGQGGFCGWRPESNAVKIWHAGNAVLVDSVNSVVRSSNTGDRFAFVQGHYGAPTEGSLRSPLVHDRLGQRRLLRLTYWKASATPSLDICLERALEEEPLQCIDTIQGPGQHQWVRRSMELSPETRPYRIALRARNLLAAEDIIGIDDIQLVDSDEEISLVGTTTPSPGAQLFGHLSSLPPPSPSSSIDIPKNPFAEGTEEEAEEQQTKIFPASSKDAAGGNGLKMAKKLAAAYAADGESENVLGQTGESLIRPQIRLSPNSNDGGGSQRALKFADSPLLVSGVAAGHGTFPDAALPFAPFNPSMSRTTPKVPIMERSEHCRAVSCTFMEGTCQWDLGPDWHSTSHGSSSIESPATSSRLASGQFKAPVASYIDFDLWMSDEAELTVSEEMVEEEGEKRANDDDYDGGGANQIPIFTRRGATDGGWHRFRVPLRPSFTSVRLLFMARLSAPINAFISLSNIRLVNSEGAEIGCQSFDEKSDQKAKEAVAAAPNTEQQQQRRLLADIGLDWLAKQPAPLQLPPALNGGPFPSPFPFSAANLPRPGQPSAQPRLHHQPQHLLAAAPFNPLKPMFEGIAPIVPLQGNPPRLTAIMDEAARKKNNEFPQLLPSPSAGGGNMPMAKLRPMGEVGDEEEEEKIRKFELESGDESHQQQQQFYGATPIPRELDEALLPIHGGGEGEEEMEKGGGAMADEATKRSSGDSSGGERQKGKLPPSRRHHQNSKLLHSGGPIGGGTRNGRQGEEAEDWPNMLEMGSGGGPLGSQKKSPPPPPSLPSSVTSVLATSHHRGWVEKAGNAGDDMDFRWRRRSRRME